MSVSVIVPSRGTSSMLSATIASILHSIDCADEPGAELIVVLNGPSAQLAAVAASHPRLRVVYEPRPGAAHARNIGMKLAVNDIFLFTDDDCTVPATWCRDHLSALKYSAATAAPVNVPYQGPITRYLDYKRIFAAPPLSAGTCRYFVTANCGMNRSQLSWSPKFDDVQFNNAAEDAALGYQIVEKGGVIHWLADAPPVVHCLGEDPGELLERTFRYGVGNAKIVNAHQRWQESSPYADDWLVSILNDRWTDYRRFTEFVSDAARRLFSAFNIVEASAWLIAYIEQTQKELAIEKFAIDRRALENDLQSYVSDLVATVAQPDSNESWEMQFDRIAHCRSGPDGDYREIAAILRRSITPQDTPDASRELRAHLQIHKERVDEEQRRIQQASLDSWQSLIGRTERITLPRLELELRAHGVTFADGLSELEKASNDLKTGRI